MKRYAGERGREFYATWAWVERLQPGDSYEGCDSATHTLRNWEAVYASVTYETDTDGPPILTLERLFVKTPPEEEDWILYDANLYGVDGSIHSAVHCASSSNRSA